MTPATVSYYTDEVARGMEDYYAGRGEAKGVWLGGGSAHDGLQGEVEAEELARLFEGCHPRTGESLGAPYKVPDGVDRVTGWDLTFSAPKSVSVVWAVGGGDTGLEVGDAHRAAVRSAIDYLEEHAAFSRTGKAGVRQVDTRGLLAAGFVHRSSRAGDPQLHTHVLVSGRVRCEDGVWRALDSRALHRQLKPAGMVYQAALRAELTARLGVEWTAVDRNGQAEIAGVPLGLRRRFAQRRAAVKVHAGELIAEQEARLGRELLPVERRRTFERAVLATRDGKDHDGETDRGLHDRWLAEATAAGHGPASWIPDTVNRLPAPAMSMEDVAAAIVAELAASRSTWRRADVTREAARRAPATAGTADEARVWIEAAADAVLARPIVVAFRTPDMPAPDQLLRRDGQSVFDRHDDTRYTTLATLEVEQRVVDLADAGRAAQRGTVDPMIVERAITGHALHEDQADAVRSVTLDGDTVACVVGPAGAGKSRTMRAAAHAWTDAGVPVRGLAVSAVAAGVLAQEAGLPSETIAKFLHEHDRPDGPDEGWRLRRCEAVVVDEAGMAATADLARLAVLVEEAHGKLVLVGDHRQLGAVEAGGLFRLLAERHAVELTGVRRFHHEWERGASLRLRAHDSAVVATYQHHGRIQAADDVGIVALAAQRWLDARSAGESMVVCAADNATVSSICATVRAARVAAGDVEPGGIPSAGGVVGVGDEIVTLRNNRSLATTSGGFVRNGDRWHIDSCHNDGSLDVSRLDGHGRVVLPGDYVADHVHLAYALTIHKAQGVTVDRGLVVVDDTTTAEALYVGMTRGRHDNTALACNGILDSDRHDPPLDAADAVAAALGRVSAEQAALHALRDTLDASESLAVLAPRLASVAAQIQRDTPDNPELELRRLAARRTYLEGHQPSRLTRARRDHHRALRGLDTRIAALDAARQARDRWLENHSDLFAYRDHLAEQVDHRRRRLAVAAVAAKPAHLVELLGDLPDDDHGRQRWATLAGRVEAYREQWGIDPDDLRQPPIDGAQHREWDSAINSIEISQRLADLATERDITRSIDRGIGIEL